jgi:hypothetical protein
MANTPFSKWLHGLGSAAITGIASAGIALFGNAAGNMIGVHIPQLTLSQFLTTIIGGGAVGAFAYLKQSPLPPEN